MLAGRSPFAGAHAARTPLYTVVGCRVLRPRCGGDAPFRFGRSAGFFVGGGLSRPALPRAPSWAVFFIVFWACALCF